jgi:integrase
MATMKRPRARRGSPRPLSARELEIVLTRAVQPYRMCALIAYEAGLRCCEIAGLHKADVGEDDVYIRKAKGGGSATVPGRPAMLIEAIRDLPDGLLVEAVGGVADARWISIRSAVYFRRSLGLPGVSMHRLRHSYAKRLRDAGHDLFVVQRQLRHQSVQSTQIYAGATDEECRQAVRGLTTPSYLSQIAS